MYTTKTKKRIEITNPELEKKECRMCHHVGRVVCYAISNGSAFFKCKQCKQTWTDEQIDPKFRTELVKEFQAKLNEADT